jgi:hypothetical protein
MIGITRAAPTGIGAVSKKSKWNLARDQITEANWVEIRKLAQTVRIANFTFEEYARSQSRPLVKLIDKNSGALIATQEDWMENDYQFLKAEAALRGAHVVVQQDGDSPYMIPVRFTGQESAEKKA